jgi:hypothetical protein
MNMCYQTFEQFVNSRALNEQAVRSVPLTIKSRGVALMEGANASLLEFLDALFATIFNFAPKFTRRPAIQERQTDTQQFQPPN